MNPYTDSLGSVGFRHVLEDGLAILGGKTLERDRQEFVLRDLAGVISEAKRCSDLVQGQSWFLANANQEAFELFALIERLTSGEDRPWTNLLDSAATTLQALAAGKPPLTAKQVQETTQFLQTVLSCVSNMPRVSGIKQVEIGARRRRASL